MPAPDREDIKAKIRRSGTTCRALGLQHGLSISAVSKALTVPSPRVERVIAEHLGVDPSSLWPDRYGRGSTNRLPRRGRQYQKGLRA